MCIRDSYKWDTETEEDVLPMWVADMDFRTAPAVVDALKKRVEHGIFGYTKVPSEYYDSIVDWFRRKHNWTIERLSLIHILLPLWGNLIQSVIGVILSVIYLQSISSRQYTFVT